jgi:hypothetical protein
MKECLGFSRNLFEGLIHHHFASHTTTSYEISRQHPGVNNEQPHSLPKGGTKIFPNNLCTNWRLCNNPLGISQHIGPIRTHLQKTLAIVLGYIHCGQNTSPTLVNPFFTKFLICGFSTARPSDLLSTITLVMRALLKNIVYKGYI